MDVLQIGRNVIENQIVALQNLRDCLSSSFNNAVDTILSCKGKIVVSGIGKSGIVGRKLAATLSSFGFPSFFVHPSDASHGDLGMIANNDLVVIISKSGNTDELHNIISYSVKQGNPIIGITMGKESLLSTMSTILLLLPEVNESYNGINAPTASATITLALGDALAIACANKKNISIDDFLRVHPGGNIPKS